MTAMAPTVDDDDLAAILLTLCIFALVVAWLVSVIDTVPLP